MRVKFVSVSSGFAFVVVRLMDKDKSEGVISGLNYHFHFLYLFIGLGVWFCLSLFIYIYWKYVAVNNMERRIKE